MTRYFDPLSVSFYDDIIHKTMPDSVIELTDDQYDVLLVGINKNYVYRGIDANGVVIFDPPNGFVFENGELKPTAETLINQLSSAKQAAQATIEAKADAYQTKFLGANSPQREARFAQNLAAAKRVVTDAGTPEDIQSMALQAQAKAAETGETPKTALEFAAWIAAWEGKTTLIAGAIEAFLVQSRAGLNALTDIAQIEPYLAQIAMQAEAKFAELAG